MYVTTKYRFRDLPAHFKTELANLTEPMLLEITQNVTNLLVEAFPDIPILPVIGNHDYFPRNSLPGEKTPLYEELGDMWQELFNDTEITEKFKEGKMFFTFYIYFFKLSFI